MPLPRVVVISAWGKGIFLVPPAVTAMFGDRFRTYATAVLIVAGLALIACTAGLAARAAARASAEWWPALSTQADGIGWLIPSGAGWFPWRYYERSIAPDA
ncbi:hypothetical protein AB4039_08130 [Streptomyces sp. M-16]|uniref:hypothetical protein n=1 Tax=Streptomyces sp. M-16 TaxID=3233040 RepID=UPI002259AA9B